MAQFILPVVGAAIGFTFGGPTGAQLGFALGSTANALFAPKPPGPQIGDLKAPKATYGSVIPYVEGHPRLPGIVIWASEKRAIKNEAEGGKGGLGGAEQSFYTYRIDVIYALAENDIGELRRVWVNGELVWSNAESSDQGTVEASAEAPWGEITLYSGADDQMPHPAYETAVGSANAPAYRGRTTVAIDDLDLGTSGQLPVITFECGGVGESSGSGEDFMYMPYANDPVDVIAPAATFVYSLSPPDYDITYNGDFASFGQTLPTGGTQNIQHAAIKATPFRTDYSDKTQYEVTITGVSVYVASPGFAAVCEFCVFRTIVTGRNAISIGAFFIDANTSQLYINKTDANGGSVATPHPIFFLDGSAERFTFRIEVPANPSNPAAINPSEPTLVYVKSDDPASAYFVETQIDAHFTGAFDYFAVGGGVRQTAGNTFHGINAFGIKDLRGYRGNARRSGGIPLSEPTLQEVVERQCLRAGINLAYVNATNLATRFVKAMAVTQITSPRAVIENLQRGYFFTAVETEGIFKFEFLGKAAVATLTFDELGAALDEPDFERLPITVAAEIEIPVQAFVRYINTFDDYQDGTEQSDRLVSPGPNTLAIELPIGFSPAEAKVIADITIQLAAVGATTGKLSLNRDYAYLEPADVVLVYDRDGNLYRVRLTTKNEADGVLTFDWVLDDATILNSSALTAGNYTNSTLVNPKADTDLEVLDAPLLRDVDDFIGVYVATQGAGSWAGAAVLQSNDGLTYTRALDSSRLAVLGSANTTLGDFAGGEVFDEINNLSVTINAPGQLASYTRDELLEFPYGVYLIGSEVVQAMNATLTGVDSDGNNVYSLSRLLRGRIGTEWAIGGHVADERVVLLTENTLSRASLNTSDVGQLRYFNGVTFGRNESTGDIENIVFQAVSQKPLAPVDLRRTELGFSWQRRTRHDTNFTGPTGSIVPLAEESESYDVELYNGATLVESDTVSGPQWLRSGLVNLGQIGAPCYGLRLIGSTFYGIRADGGFGLYPRQIVTFNSDGGEIETLATGATTSTISVGDTVLQFESTATNLYFASYSQPPLGAITAQIYRVAVADINTIAATLTNTNATYFPGIAHDGTNLWACENPDKLYRLNSSTLAVVNTYTISSALFYGQMRFSAGNLYIANSFDHTIVVVNPATGVESSRFSVVPNPGGLYIVGTVAFVTSLTSAQLGVYDLTIGAQLQIHDMQASSNLSDLSFGLFNGEVAVCSVDLNIYFFNATTGALVRKSRVPGQKYVNSIALATAGGLYLTGEPTPPITNTSRQTYKFEVGADDLTGYSLVVYQNSATVGRGYPAEKTL